jgi:hypothetical protein
VRHVARPAPVAATARRKQSQSASRRIRPSSRRTLPRSSDRCSSWTRRCPGFRTPHGARSPRHRGRPLRSAWRGLHQPHSAGPSGTLSLARARSVRSDSPCSWSTRHTRGPARDSESGSAASRTRTYPRHTASERNSPHLRNEQAATSRHSLAPLTSKPEHIVCMSARAKHSLSPDERTYGGGQRPRFSSSADPRLSSGRRP